MSRSGETAAQLDTAIDALIGQRGHLWPVDEDELQATARLLRDALPRFHPRFGFEELLAGRLRLQAAVAGGSVEHPARLSLAEPTPLSGRLPAASTVSSAPPAWRRRRTLAAGGAIASGVSLAIPIAGAVLVAWRRARNPAGLL